jgi:hypothetical protein
MKGARTRLETVEAAKDVSGQQKAEATKRASEFVQEATRRIGQFEEEATRRMNGFNGGKSLGQLVREGGVKYVVLKGGVRVKIIDKDTDYQAYKRHAGLYAYELFPQRSVQNIKLQEEVGLEESSKFNLNLVFFALRRARAFSMNEFSSFAAQMPQVTGWGQG